MIKYVCKPIKENNNSKLREQFQNLQKEINVANKCPKIYYKSNDICCPVPLEDNICPVDKKDPTHINGMPICALTINAAVQWKDDNGKILYLCTDLPPISKSYERINDETNICSKNMILINNKCYPICPPGFRDVNGSCIQTKFERESLSEPILCPDNSDNINGKCLKKCDLGYNNFNNYCIPSQLSGF